MIGAIVALGMIRELGPVLTGLMVVITEYYTSCDYAPVKNIAKASTTGHATNIIAGVAVGLESTAIPVFVVSVAILGSYWLGQSSGLQS